MMHRALSASGGGGGSFAIQIKMSSNTTAESIVADHDTDTMYVFNATLPQYRRWTVTVNSTTYSPSNSVENVNSAVNYSGYGMCYDKISATIKSGDTVTINAGGSNSVSTVVF